MVNTKHKMKVSDFLTYHIRCYNYSAVALGIVDVKIVTINKKQYVELVTSTDETDQDLLLCEIEEELIGVDEKLYVVLFNNGKYEYVTTSSGGLYEIKFGCSVD